MTVELWFLAVAFVATGVYGWLLLFSGARSIEFALFMTAGMFFGYLSLLGLWFVFGAGRVGGAS